MGNRRSRLHFGCLAPRLHSTLVLVLPVLDVVAGRRYFAGRSESGCHSARTFAACLARRVVMSLWLAKDQRSNEVVALQNALNIRLKPAKPLALDGIFGPHTEAAVREFQKCEKLKADGIAGPRTLGALFVLRTVTRTFVLTLGAPPGVTRNFRPPPPRCRCLRPTTPVARRRRHRRHRPTIVAGSCGGSTASIRVGSG